MTIILWKILIVSIILTETMIGAFLGWRVLRLMARVQLIQVDRNEVNEERRKLSDKLRLKGIEVDQLNKERPELSDLEKKMMLAALNMPEYGKSMQDPKTSFQARKTWRDLKEKIKGSFK